MTVQRSYYLCKSEKNSNIYLSKAERSNLNEFPTLPSDVLSSAYTDAILNMLSDNMQSFPC